MVYPTMEGGWTLNPEFAPGPAHAPGVFGVCRPGPSTSPPLPARQVSAGKRCVGRQTRGQMSPTLRRSPVNTRPAICPASTQPLSRPVCSYGSPQGHCTKATLPQLGTTTPSTRQISPAPWPLLTAPRPHVGTPAISQGKTLLLL